MRKFKKRLQRLKNIITVHKKITIGWLIISFLLCMLFSSYCMQSLLKLRGFINGTASISFNPIDIVYYGLLTTLGALVTFIMWLIINYAVAHTIIVMREKEIVDERGVVHSEEGTHGTAREADEDIIDEYFEEANLLKTGKMIMGVHPKTQRPLVIKDKYWNTFNGMIFAVGGSGTRKTRSLVMNQVFSSIVEGEKITAGKKAIEGTSLIITDPKGEIYAKTAVVAKKHGYTIKMLNIKDPSHSDTINLLKELGQDVASVQTFIDVFIQNTGGKQDLFWDNAAENFMTALTLMVIFDETCPDRSFRTIYNLITTKKVTELDAMFRNLKNVKINGQRHPALDNYHFFAEQTMEKKNSVLEGLGLRLKIFQDRNLLDLISTDDISLIDPGKTKCIYYIIMEDRHRRKDLVSAMFFTFLIDRLMMYADSQKDECLPVPVRCLLDEMANSGKLEHFKNWITVTRSRKITFTCVFQDIGQVMDYTDESDNAWTTIKGSCDVDIYYGSNDITLTGEHYSKMSGQMTEHVNTLMEGKEAFSLNAFQDGYRETTLNAARAVRLPDEIRGLPSDECIIYLKSTNKSFKLKKFDYSNHPMSKEIEIVHFMDYNNDKATNNNTPVEDAAKKQAPKESEVKKDEPVTEETASVPPPISKVKINPAIKTLAPIVNHKISTSTVSSSDEEMTMDEINEDDNEPKNWDDTPVVTLEQSSSTTKVQKTSSPKPKQEPSNNPDPFGGIDITKAPKVMVPNSAQPTMSQDTHNALQDF